MLKGSVPWRAVSEQKLHEKLISEPLDSLTVGLPDIARQFLSKVLQLNPKNRMNIEEMHNWCSKLASIEIISYPHPEPLREVKQINNMICPPINARVEPKPFFTPKENSGNTFQFSSIPKPPPTQKNQVL